jgi:NAD(P)H-dependent FMN reductase
LLEERLSSRKVYEVACTLERLPEPTDPQEPRWTRLLALEVRRSLSRVGEGSMSSEEVGLPLDEAAGYAALHRRVRAWVDRILIAGTFAASMPRIRRPTPGGAP